MELEAQAPTTRLLVKSYTMNKRENWGTKKKKKAYQLREYEKTTKLGNTRIYVKNHNPLEINSLCEK